MKYQQLPTYVAGCDTFQINMERSNVVITNLIQNIKGVLKAQPALYPGEFIVILDNSQPCKSVMDAIEELDK